MLPFNHAFAMNLKAFGINMLKLVVGHDPKIMFDFLEKIKLVLYHLELLLSPQ